MKKKIIIAVISLVMVIALVGCSQATVQGTNQVNSGVTPDTQTPSASPENNQQNPPSGNNVEQNNTPQVVSVAQVMQNSKELENKDVILEGKIVQECGSGCWFNLEDKTGVIYVDLLPSNLAIPQKVGSKAKVYGVVTIEKGVTYIIGKKVEF